LPLVMTKEWEKMTKKAPKNLKKSKLLLNLILILPG